MSEDIAQTTQESSTTSTLNRATDIIKDYTSSVRENVSDFALGKNAYKRAAAAIFPESLNLKGGSRHTDDYSKRPIIKFENMESRQDVEETLGLPTTIYLPAPVNAGFTDSSEYNDKSLGAMGGALLDVAQASRGSIKDGDSMGQVFNNALDTFADGAGGIDNLVENIGNTLKGQVAKKLSSMDAGVANAAIQFMGVTGNPNVVTEYSSTATRSFTMSYKLVPSSQGESIIINEIIKSFRFATRPAGTYFYLKYPPKWKITFHQGIDNDAELTSLPRLDYCYLTSLQANANGDNAWFHDGQPTTYDITMQWQERKVLTANQILKLETGAYPDRGSV